MWKEGERQRERKGERASLSTHDRWPHQTAAELGSRENEGCSMLVKNKKEKEGSNESIEAGGNERIEQRP